MKTKRIGSILTLAVAGALAAMNASAQITNVVFTDDFSKTGIDTGKYAVDSPFFEGGKGTIAPKVENGVLEFTGTVTEQWWAGATLRVIEPIAISPETNVVVTVDRIEETGGTTGSRSALWIMDESRTKYVLYAEVYNEGGWHYNRYIGETGDVRTGGGTNIDPFDGTDAVTGVNYDDQGLHRMQVLANGKTVKLYLDGKYGTEVKFPFDKDGGRVGQLRPGEQRHGRNEMGQLEDPDGGHRHVLPCGADAGRGSDLPQPRGPDSSRGQCR